MYKLYLNLSNFIPVGTFPAVAFEAALPGSAAPGIPASSLKRGLTRLSENTALAVFSKRLRGKNFNIFQSFHSSV